MKHQRVAGNRFYKTYKIILALEFFLIPITRKQTADDTVEEC